MRERERDRDRDSDSQPASQPDRQPDRQTETEKQRPTDRPTDRQRETERERERDRDREVFQQEQKEIISLSMEIIFCECWPKGQRTGKAGGWITCPLAAVSRLNGRLSGNPL